MNEQELDKLRKKIIDAAITLAIYIPTFLLSLVMLIGGAVLSVRFFLMTGAILVGCSIPTLIWAVIKLSINYKKFKEETGC